MTSQTAGTQSHIRAQVRPIRKREQLCGRGGMFGIVQIDHGGAVYHLHVSRLDGENGWTVDAIFENHMPRWNNGIGWRFSATTPVTEPWLIDMLDKAAADVTAALAVA